MKFTFVITLLFLNDKPACVASVVNLSSVLSCRHLSNATPRFPRVLARLWLWRCYVVGRCSSAPLWIELLKPWWLVAAWWKSALCCINIKQTPHIPPALYVRIAQKVKYCFKSLFAPKNSSVTDPNTQAPPVKKQITCGLDIHALNTKVSTLNRGFLWMRTSDPDREGLKHYYNGL
jgi:hypothetical protein